MGRKLKTVDAATAEAILGSVQYSTTPLSTIKPLTAKERKAIKQREMRAQKKAEKEATVVLATAALSVAIAPDLAEETTSTATGIPPERVITSSDEVQFVSTVTLVTPNKALLTAIKVEPSSSLKPSNSIPPASASPSPAPSGVLAI
jgi:hypothetical protein